MAHEKVMLGEGVVEMVVAVGLVAGQRDGKVVAPLVDSVVGQGGEREAERSVLEVAGSEVLAQASERKHCDPVSQVASLTAEGVLKGQSQRVSAWVFHQRRGRPIEEGHHPR